MNPERTATEAIVSAAITAGLSDSSLESWSTRRDREAIFSSELVKLNVAWRTHGLISTVRPLLCSRSPQNNLTGVLRPVWVSALET